MQAPHLFPTRIAMSAEVRTVVVDRLNDRLADAADLYSQTKHAHWNVKGPDFQQLHELFDKLAATLEDHADQLAERATALGGFAQGTLRRAAERSSLPELGDTVLGNLLVAEMAQRYAQYANQLRQDALDCEAWEDPVTQDLLTELAGESDKALYFLEAHLVDVETAAEAQEADLGPDDVDGQRAGNGSAGAGRGRRRGRAEARATGGDLGSAGRAGGRRTTRGARAASDGMGSRRRHARPTADQ